MKPEFELSPAKIKLLECLNARGTARVTELASDLKLTTAAVRQHLGALLDADLVNLHEATVARSAGRGRPPNEWSLSPKARAIFPDRHAELAGDLMRTVRLTLGESSLDELIDQRARDHLEVFRQHARATSTDLKSRVDALAEQRTADGYMAEVIEEDDGSFLLIENHCPICAAATACRRLCESELWMFQEAMGSGVSVTREEHLLSEGARCVYRIQETAGRERSSA